MVLAAPVFDGDRPVGVLAADLDLTTLYRVVQTSRFGSGSALLISPAAQVLVQTSRTTPRTENDLLQAGALRETVDTVPAKLALQGRAGVRERVRIQGKRLRLRLRPDRGGGLGRDRAREPRRGLLGRRRSAPDRVRDHRHRRPRRRRAGRAVRAPGGAPDRSIRAAARSVAGGDLTTRVEPRGSAEFQDLGGSFNSMVGSLGALVKRIDTASAELSGSAGQLAAAAEQLAASTQEQSTAATQTSATMEELARTFTTIADTISDVATQTADTREVLDDTDRDLQASSERVLSLARARRRGRRRC